MGALNLGAPPGQSAAAAAAVQRAKGAIPAPLRQLLCELREELHRHPELSWQEERTARRLCEALREVGVQEIEQVAGTGVLGLIPGRDRKRHATVALRGDIDALPIEEASGLPFSSQTPGVMHACGHDVHATWAVGAAALLCADPAPGDVMCILQPAEEVGQGAGRLLESGGLDEVAAIFGAHVDRRFAVGELVVQEGPVAAATDEFTVRIEGRGGHGARPHLGADPIVAAAALVQALQTIVSRRLAPGDPGVVTVGQLHAGTAPNIIPSSALLAGTLRSCSDTARRAIAESAEQICRDVAAAYGVQADFSLQQGTPPIVNPAQATTWAREAAVELFGEEILVPLPEINMGGEDFAFYLERMAGCFLRIGAREPEGEVIGAHTPQFYAAQEAVWMGSTTLAAAARRASRALEK